MTWQLALGLHNNYWCIVFGKANTEKRTLQLHPLYVVYHQVENSKTLSSKQKEC